MPGREKRKRSTATNPLGEDLNAHRFASLKGPQQESVTGGDAKALLEDEGGFTIPKKSTQRILRTARDQLEVTAEEVREFDEDANADEVTEAYDDVADVIEPKAFNEAMYGREAGSDADEEEEDVELEYSDSESIMSEVPTAAMMDLDPAELGISDEEARLLQMFRPATQAQTRNLADMIMEKIREKEQAGKKEVTGGEDDDDGRSAGPNVDRRVARVYSAIGTALKKYTSGKIPKAFKVLPHIQNWEQLLMLTRPDEWSPHATYQATRIFAANLNEKMAQRFYAAVLLPIIHHYLLEEKKLHPSLYMAVRKALFKPVAFYKGFLLPLAQDEECTLKEALVIASVLQRSHLPPVPTAVMIVKIASLTFSGPCSVFLRVLIDKKMALPYQAIDALVAYFHRFMHTHGKEDTLPVLWHQTILSFAQRYKEDLTVEQIELLSQVCSRHFHHMITPEIRRELNAAMRLRRGGPPVPQPKRLG